MSEQVQVWESETGLRVAQEGPWRMVGYREGGYTINRWIGGRLGWVLLGADEPPADQIPPEVEKRLCDALGIELNRPQG